MGKTGSKNKLHLEDADTLNWPSPAEVRRFQKLVWKWFAEHKRDLPWRRTRDRYHVWISEIMLQQTQVATVIDYWKRFVAAFPRVNDLAAADQADVLKLWEGLGYYRRARQLHAAAQQIVEKHDGEFPDDFDSVLALPGIGRYTAGAILSIAEDQPLPILEGNTIRLYARLLGLKTDPTKSANQKVLWQFAEQIVPATDAGAFNQGLMEIGGQICKPKSPSCLICPLQKHCHAFAKSLQDQIPAPKEKAIRYEDRHEYLVVLQRNGKYLCRQSKPDERWAGLWDFARLDLTDVHMLQENQAKWNDTEVGRQQETLAWLKQELQDQTGLTADYSVGDWRIRHGVTRFRIQLQSILGREVRGRLKKDSPYLWLTLEQLHQLPFNVTARKFIADHFPA